MANAGAESQTAVVSQQESEALLKISTEKEYYKQLVRDLGWTRDELKIIYNKLPQGVPIEELFSFLTQARKLGLDPISGQIIMQSHKMKGGEVRYTTIVGIDGYRSMAIRTGLYAPGNDTVFEYKPDGSLHSATVYGKRYHPESNTWNEFSAKALYDEYCVMYWDDYSKTRKPTQMWDKMPHTMLEKCAEAKALRRGFPETLAGLYTVEELSQVNSATASAEEGVKRGSRLVEKTEKALEAKS